MLTSRARNNLSWHRLCVTPHAVMWCSERQDVMEQRLIVIVPADMCDLEVVCAMLQDAGYDALILDCTAPVQQLQRDRRYARPNAAAPAQKTAPPPPCPSNPEAAALAVFQEISELLNNLPFGWQVAIIKALLTHACAVARHRGPPPRHTTLSS